ncbi:MAG TPA: ABC transporter ATP-binding protein [Actinomycetota bacterium]|jgi:putative ABC transport system ATP-binding protein|nr:ABC transporter ATP-binding protein [Actinomycetota bacterium]
MNAIEAKDIWKTYSTNGASVHALAGVDIEVREGEFVAVMGPSGSGKSTLLHIIGGLDTPDEGRVAIGGEDISNFSKKELAAMRRKHIGFVFQFFNLVPVLTVEENIALPAALDGAREADYAAKLGETLDTFGIAEHRTKLPAQLSGGEQQRVAIARALLNEPAVVLADEPTGNLDRGSGADVMALLRRLHKQRQTIVVVTHDPAVASFAQRVVFMRDGRLVDEARLRTPGKASAVLSKLVKLEM